MRVKFTTRLTRACAGAFQSHCLRHRKRGLQHHVAPGNLTLYGSVKLLREIINYLVSRGENEPFSSAKVKSRRGLPLWEHITLNGGLLPAVSFERRSGKSF
jgi:hypothetical protein